MHSSSLLWITDPWNTLTHYNDTTLRLMQEALNLGISCYWSAPDFILKSKSLNKLCVVPVIGSAQSFPFNEVELDSSKFHHIHYRIDPPVDFNYKLLLDQLISRGVQKGQIKNPPDILKDQSEKIPPPPLRIYAPRMHVTEESSNGALNNADLTAILTLFKDDAWVVTKPLNLAQSMGVKKYAVPQRESEWIQLIKTETENFSKGMVIQEYLAEVNDGEVRVWYAAGDIVACLKKFPKTGDFRVLIDEGSKVAAYFLTEKEETIALEVGRVLRTQGVLMAAIDFIGGKISDFNITSPGLLVQLEEVHGGKNFAKIIIEKLMAEKN